MNIIKDPLYILKIDGLDEEKALFIYSFSGKEEISGIYEYEFELLSESAGLKSEEVLQDLTLLLMVWLLKLKDQLINKVLFQSQINVCVIQFIILKD